MGNSFTVDEILAAAGNARSSAREVAFSKRREELEAIYRHVPGELTLEERDELLYAHTWVHISYSAGDKRASQVQNAFRKSDFLVWTTPLEDDVRYPGSIGLLEVSLGNNAKKGRDVELPRAPLHFKSADDAFDYLAKHHDIIDSAYQRITGKQV